MLRKTPTVAAPPVSPGPTVQQRQSAAYACDLLLELRNVTRSAGLRHLTYLIELAVYEAFELANDRPATTEDIRQARRTAKA